MTDSSVEQPGPRRARVLALWCRFRGHEPLSDRLDGAHARKAGARGGGRDFSTCRRCGAEITRGRTLAWRALSQRERIVRAEEGPPRLLRG
jgi:hypothetical protein